MNTVNLVQEWFAKWEDGNFFDIPVSENFKHTSPFGTITGKDKYLDIINKSKDDFLGHQFDILDAVYEDAKASVRYKATKAGSAFHATEWFYIKDDKIVEVISYYNAG